MSRIQNCLLVLLLGAGLSSLLAAPSVAAIAKDGPGEARVAGSCTGGATSELRLEAKDGTIEVRFRIDRGRPSVVWHVTVVHERRIAWRGAVRTARSGGSFEVRRTLRDLSGADEVTASAWGPRGAACRATATLRDA